MQAKDDPAMYEAQVKSIHEHLTEHNNDEETKDLPPLEAKLTAQESEDAAASFKRAKKLAPTRVHPSLPGDSSYLESATTLLAMPIDRLRDLFTKFPDEAMKAEMK
jgi:hypothetical protein